MNTRRMASAVILLACGPVMSCFATASLLATAAHGADGASPPTIKEDSRVGDRTACVAAFLKEMQSDEGSLGRAARSPSTGWA